MRGKLALVQKSKTGQKVDKYVENANFRIIALFFTFISTKRHSLASYVHIQHSPSFKTCHSVSAKKSRFLADTLTCII